MLKSAPPGTLLTRRQPAVPPHAVQFVDDTRNPLGERTANVDSNGKRPNRSAEPISSSEISPSWTSENNENLHSMPIDMSAAALNAMFLAKGPFVARQQLPADGVSCDSLAAAQMLGLDPVAMRTHEGDRSSCITPLARRRVSSYGKPLSPILELQDEAPRTPGVRPAALVHMPSPMARDSPYHPLRRSPNSSPGRSRLLSSPSDTLAALHAALQADRQQHATSTQQMHEATRRGCDAIAALRRDIEHSTAAIAAHLASSQDAASPPSQQPSASQQHSASHTQPARAPASSHATTHVSADLELCTPRRDSVSIARRLEATLGMLDRALTSLSAPDDARTAKRRADDVDRRDVRDCRDGRAEVRIHDADGRVVQSRSTDDGFASIADAATASLASTSGDEGMARRGRRVRQVYIGTQDAITVTPGSVPPTATGLVVGEAVAYTETGSYSLLQPGDQIVEVPTLHALVPPYSLCLPWPDARSTALTCRRCRCARRCRLWRRPWPCASLSPSASCATAAARPPASLVSPFTP
jgi:hypothetical protein